MLAMTSSSSMSRDSGRPTLTMGDHVGVEDEVVEEGQHINHLVFSFGLCKLTSTERLWNVGLEEGRVDCVHDLQGDDCTQAHIEQVLAVDRLLGLIVGEVVADASIF
jgi:hypothetical protein